MSDVTNIAKNSDKSKYEYSSYGIAFDGLGSWFFGKEFARNAITFGVNNSSSSHTDNCKNNFVVLSDGPTNDINFSKATTKFA